MIATDTRRDRLSRLLARRPRLLWAGLLALALGALAACGFQPLALWPLTIIAIAGLVELAARARTRWQAFAVGWLFGVSHFSVGDNWIATAFTYQAAMPAWLGGVAVVLLSLYLAVFPGLATLASREFVMRVRRGGAVADYPLRGFGLVFAGFWIVTEWMRGWAFTGFPWNPLGIALLGPFDAQGPAILARWIGTYGLSGLLVVLAATLRHLVRSGARGPGRRRVVATFQIAALSAIVAAWMTVPAFYLAHEEGTRRFTLVQPDLPQETIGNPDFYEVNFDKLARLTMADGPDTRRVVFWPESGLVDYLRDGYPPYLYRMMDYGGDPALARARIGRVIGPQSLLLTGAVDLVIENGEEVGARNSVTALDGHGNLLASYAKAHLVPYGEYLPMPWLLEHLGLRRLVAGSLDFRPGPGPRTFDFGPWGKAGVQICYEIVFSGEVVDPHSRPDYIFNPSNDGWFGSWGPPQHLAQARLRAMEEGLPILRSTTTGISAVIDADGIVRAYVPRLQPGRIDGLIPPPHSPTPFARLGNVLPLALALVLLMLSAVALRQNHL